MTYTIEQIGQMFESLYTSLVDNVGIKTFTFWGRNEREVRELNFI